MRSRKGSKGNVEDVNINLTPLIDVVFVVLIIFIIVAPMLEVDRIDLAAAPAREERKSASASEQKTLVVHVQENNTILVQGRVVSLKDLKGVLAIEKKRLQKKSIQLFQDKRASFGTYQSVKNAAEEVGFEELDLVLKPS